MFRIIDNLISQNNLLIKIDEITTERVNNAKFLGVIINSTLSWKDCITILCKKVSKNIGILNKIKANVNYDILTLYNTLLLSFFNYCNNIGLLVLFILLDCS